MDEDDITIQLGITLDDDGTPLVVMILSDPFLDDDEDDMSILIGDAEEATVFATQLVRAGQVTLQLKEDLEGVTDPDQIRSVLENYAKRLNAPYN